MTAKTLDFQYRGGWGGQQTWSDSEARWVRVAIKGDRRVEQGALSFEHFLDALDRIDGRPVMRDFLAGLEAGLSQEDASRPLPFGADGEPLPTAPALPVPPAPAALPVAPLLSAGVQLSLFDEEAFA